MKQLRWWRKPKKPSDKTDLSRYFAALRNQEPADSFSDVQDWITGLPQRVDTREQHTNMPLSQMKVFLYTYKTRLIVTSLFLAVTVISCTTPVEQEETIGYMLSGMIESEKAVSATNKLSALAWVEPSQLDLSLVSTKELLYDNADVYADKAETNNNKVHQESESKVHRFVIALPQSDEAEASAHAYDLKLIEGIRDVEVAPLQITSEKPVYKVVLNSFRDKNSNMELLSDKEKVQAAINKYLEALEMYGVEVKQDMDAKGNYVLSMSPPEDMDQSGMVTLKRFLEEAAFRNNSSRSGQSSKPVNAYAKEAALLKMINEIELRISQTEMEETKKKMQAELEQLQAKMEALRNTQK